MSTYDDSILLANPGLIISGQRKPAQGDLKGCIVQSLVCAGCETPIGITCVEASADKSHCRDRSFLSLDTLTMKSMANGQVVPPCVTRKSQRISELAHAHTGKMERRPASPAASKNAQNHGIQAPMNMNGHRSPNSVSDQGLSTLLEGQRKDIDRVMANVDTLLQDMKTLKNSVEYLKFQQQTFENFTDNELAKSPTTLTSDLHNLTERMSLVSSKADKVHSLTEGLNALTERVSQVDRGVGEVGELRSELKHLKQRIKRLENANANTQVLNLVSKSEGSFVLDSQEIPAPLRNEPVISQEVPSSTRSHSEHTTAYVRRSSSTISPEEIGLQYVSDSVPDRALDQSQNSTDGHTTPSGNLIELLQPQITSAEKVLAQKRRRSPSSSSSSSSSSSLAAPPPNKWHMNRSGIHNQPEWNTKPKFRTIAKRKITSLNDPEHVLTSDPEDSDYDPNSLPQDLPDQQNTKDLPRIRSKPPLRLPTPEWEKPDWENPYRSTSNRGRHHSTARRGVSGRGAIASDRGRRRSSGIHTNRFNEYVTAQSPDYWLDDPPSSSSGRRYSETPDSLFAKRRDSKGRLLRSDGKVDGRSLRQQREKDERMRRMRRLERQVESRQQQQEQQQQQQQQESNMAWIPTIDRGSGKRFVDAAALAAAGLEITNRNVGGQEDGIVATTAPANGNGQVNGEPSLDRNPSLMETSQISSTGTLIKQETGSAGVPTTAAVASTVSAVSAAPGPEGGGQTHAKIMKQMFPWR